MSQLHGERSPPASRGRRLPEAPMQGQGSQVLPSLLIARNCRDRSHPFILIATSTFSFTEPSERPETLSMLADCSSDRKFCTKAYANRGLWNTSSCITTFRLAYEMAQSVTHIFVRPWWDRDSIIAKSHNLADGCRIWFICSVISLPTNDHTQSAIECTLDHRMVPRIPSPHTQLKEWRQESLPRTLHNGSPLPYCCVVRRQLLVMNVGPTNIKIAWSSLGLECAKMRWHSVNWKILEICCMRGPLLQRHPAHSEYNVHTLIWILSREHFHTTLTINGNVTSHWKNNLPMWHIVNPRVWSLVDWDTITLN